MGATAVAGVFASAELLDAIILPHFTRREAAQVARVSRGFSAAVQRCKHRLRPRLLVACSGNSKLVEINPWTGELLHSVNAHRTVKKSSLTGSRTRTNASRWCTSLSFSPYDHALYLCQYKDEAVLRYNGASLRYTSLSARGCPAPEGIAFACQHMYIASVERASILRFDLNGTYVGCFLMPTHLPWGMTAFRGARGEALYVCVDEPFDAVHYGTPNPSGNRGAVLVIPLRDDGSPKKGRCLCGDSTRWTGQREVSGRGSGLLNRPSGLCFGNDGQDMYVTSLTDKVLRFGGPNHPQPGTYLGVAVDTAAAGLAHPFDVRWQRETRRDANGSRLPDYLVVTTHTAERRRKGVDNRSRVSIFTEDGTLMRSIEAPVLNEPNMVVME